MSAPIADLSYRNYSGKLESPRMRWWVIARTLIGLNLRNGRCGFSRSYRVGITSG